MELIDWQGHLAIFNGNRNTKPIEEIEGDFQDISEKLAPRAGPTVSSDKLSVKYFLGTKLKKAPLIGKTRKHAERNGLSLIGKQRSASHVTTASMLVLDVDGLPKEDVKTCIEKLKSEEMTFLIFSSYSHGKPGNNGVRCRLIIPVDKPLDANNYKEAAGGFSSLYLGGQADKSGATLCQQQGVWATHPKWKENAFKQLSLGRVAASEQLIAASPVKHLAQPKKMQNPFTTALYPDVFDAARVRLALAWIDPNPHKSWVDTAIFLKAAYGDESYEVWLHWGNSVSEDIKVGNTGDYAPDALWYSLDPFLPPDVAAGTLFLTARQEADRAVQRAIKSHNWQERAQDAIGYLMAHHSSFFRENYEGER